MKKSAKIVNTAAMPAAALEKAGDRGYNVYGGFFLIRCLIALKELIKKWKNPGIIGSLYICFSDKDKKGRTGHIIFEGRDYELGKQKEDENWIKLHVMREDSNDGQLILKAKVKGGPDLIISKIALMEE